MKNFFSFTILFTLCLGLGFPAYGELKEDGPPLQQAVKSAIAERTKLGLPVPSEAYEFDVATNPDHYIKITGRTILQFDNPEQAGLEKWQDFVVEDSMLPNGTGFVQPGDYTPAVRDSLEQELPGIWDMYEFGYEPRAYILEETFEITYPEEDSVLTSTTREEDIVMGFTYSGPRINYTIHERWQFCFEVCLPWPADDVCWRECVTLAEARAGFALDWGIGLRLPVNVSLTTPYLMTQGCSYMLNSAITALDWSEADFQNAGVPRPEGGNEFVLRFELFLGFWVKILGTTVLDWSIDTFFDQSRSFTTPLGPGATFPIPQLDLGPDQTGLKWGWSMAWVGLGFAITPELSADKITASWAVVPGSDASPGSGQITYSSPGNPVTFGPVTAGEFGPNDYAHIRLADLVYS